jgi:hypothetical protein
MVWDALANRVLAGSNRKKEIQVEKQSEYDQWTSEIHSEIAVFVRRVNNLYLNHSEDRSKFYEFADRLSDRLQDLRERSESSGAPPEALIKLEELVETINNNSSDVSVSVAYIGDDPFKKARREEERQQREQERIERTYEKRERIAESIEQFTAVLDGDIEGEERLGT